ncbi:venom factor-like [Discoglossus pictus]
MTVPLPDRCSLITPSVLRVGIEETLVLDAQGHGSDFAASVQIQDFPWRTKILHDSRIYLNSGNGFLGTVTATVLPKDFPTKSKKKQFVYVTVKSPICSLEKILLLSFDNGFIFIQSDKTIYTPGSTVLYRVFTWKHKMKPEKEELTIELLSPDGAVMRRDLAHSVSPAGITSLSYNLHEFASFGTWTISAAYGRSQQQKTTTNFKVKEYVLPSIKVDLKTQNFYQIANEEFQVDILAEYLFEKLVNGTAYVLFGVKINEEKRIFPDTLRMLEIKDGEGQTGMKRGDLLKYFPNLEELLGHYLYVTVTVVSDSGRDIVTAEIDNIFIVKSPFKIHFTQTPKYFKPGVPYDLMIFVTNADGSPADRIPVVVEPGTVRGITNVDGTIRLKLDTHPNTDSLQITVKTEHQHLPNSQQTSASMAATGYRPLAGLSNYLHISVVNYQMKLGDHIKVNFHVRNSDQGVRNQIQHITYLVLNRGMIVRAERLKMPQGVPIVSMSLLVTEAMMPSFRIVAYYMVMTTAGREIVSDSIWLNVKSICKGTLEVTDGMRSDNKVQSPGGSMNLKLRADYKAQVALVIVDKGVYELDKKLRLSQSKVWDSMENSDPGCTPGSGADSLGVFYDAGLALQTDFKMKTAERTDLTCQSQGKRKRRSADDDDFYMDEKDIISRTRFPESWFWKVEQMSNRPDASGVSTKFLYLSLTQPVTTWNVLAVSLHESKGLCVSQPHEMKVSKTFFIDLKLPYSVVKNEQVEIQAIVYNQGNTAITVRVELSHSNDFCSISKTKKPRQVVTIKSLSSVTVPFTILPLALGLHDIEVKATVALSRTSDGVKKKIKVVEGIILTRTIKIMTMDPSNNGEDGVQTETFQAPNDKNIVPFSDTFTITTICASQTSHILDATTYSSHVSHLIIEPFGSGEENMMRMSYSMISTYYLDTTGDWEKIGVDRRQAAIDYIKKGFILQLTFLKQDNSYGNAIDIPSSTWLTAYATKVFSMASSSVVIDTNFLCGSIKWLILEKQRSDGQFMETKPVLAQQMMGGISRSPEPEVTLTAFVLIALLESQDKCAMHVSNLHYSIERASLFLLDRYPHLVKPYSIAITSCALAMAGKLQDPGILLAAASDKTHWVGHGSSLVSLEATSYALLALLRMKQLSQIGPIVRWITDQAFYGKVEYGSLQATIMQFQALAQYHQETSSMNELNMIITISSWHSFKPVIYRHTRENELHSAESRVVTKLAFPSRSINSSTLGDSEAGTSGDSEAGTSGDLEAGTSGDLEAGTSGDLEAGTSGDSEAGTSGDLKAGTSGDSEAGTSGDSEAGTSGDLEAGTSGDSEAGTSGDSEAGTSGDLEAGTSGDSEAGTSGDSEAGTSGDSEAVMMSYVQVTAPYSAPKENPCKNFDLSVTTKDQPQSPRPRGAKSTVSINVCVRSLKQDGATMSILDISMLTGFSLDVEELNKLMTKSIYKFEFNKGASERSNTIIYMNKISHTEKECLTLLAHQFFDVGLIQPASVTVYEYSSPDIRCTTPYHVDAGSAQIQTLCQDGQCRCAEGACFMQQEIDGDITAALRVDKACDTGVDFVYKVTLLAIDNGDSYDSYTMKIIRILKEDENEGSEGKTHTFKSPRKCQKSLNLKTGRDYLIWGSTLYSWRLQSGQSYVYTAASCYSYTLIIGEDTWVEWWPNETECQDTNNKPICYALLEFSETMDFYGCLKDR